MPREGYDRIRAVFQYRTIFKLPNHTSKLTFVKVIRER
jgi:hypothetical protein